MCLSAETSQQLLALSLRLHDLITCKYVCPWRLINTHRFISCRNDSYANWDFSDEGTQFDDPRPSAWGVLFFLQCAAGLTNQTLVWDSQASTPLHCMALWDLRIHAGIPIQLSPLAVLPIARESFVSVTSPTLDGLGVYVCIELGMGNVTSLFGTWCHTVWPKQVKMLTCRCPSCFQAFRHLPPHKFWYN